MTKSKKPEILWLTENYYPNRGGMAQSCDRIVYNLRQSGVVVHLVHFTHRRKAFRPQSLVNGTYTAASFENDEAHTLNLLWNHLQEFATQHTLTQIVAFGGHLPVLAAPVFARWLNIPLVTLIRGNDFDASVFSHKKRETLFFALKNSACICAVSQNKKLNIKNLFPEKRVEYVPNGIDTAQWKALESDNQKAASWRKQHVAPGNRLIGLFGHLKEKKGVHFFLDALQSSSALRQKIHLLVVGEISTETRQTLAQSGVQHTILPFLDMYELLAFYPACDALAIPSFYDGMPNVLLEGGALGIPFIASATDGMKDLLSPETAFLFQPGNTKQCASAIYNFTQASNQELKQMGEKCAALIAQSYTHTAEAKRYAQIFSEI